MIDTPIERAARLAGLLDSTPLLGLQNLMAARVLEPVDLHVTAMLAARFGEVDSEVLVAVALAIRAPRYGHVCIDLRALDATSLIPEGPGHLVEPEVSLPASRQAWLERVARSALVRAPGPGDAPFVLRGTLLYTDRYFAYESGLEVALRNRLAQRRQVRDPALLARGLDALFSTDAAQGPNRPREAARVALTHGMAVISGGPGTGKTWTVRNLLTLIYAQGVAAGNEQIPRVALAAPTGKAAARMVQSLRAGLDEHLVCAMGALPEGATVDGLRAFLDAAVPSTLHRLLGWRPDSPTRFRHDRNRPLPLDLVVVDEASMVDVALMSKLIDAVADPARIVLLGDRHQLASVEAGSVLADICGSGESGTGPTEAVVFLQHSHRFHADSGIGRFAQAVVSGTVDDAVAALPRWGPGEPGPLAPGCGNDLGRVGHPPRGGLAACAARLVVEGYRPYLQRLQGGPKSGETHNQFCADVLALFGGFQVLCAHRRGFDGVEGMGEAVTDLLTHEGLIQPSGPWWLGRPILVTHNDYSVRRFNGDIGIVVRDEAGEWAVAFPSDGGSVAWLSPVRLPEHETVFAMTIHKSQGSEFDDVLVVLPVAPSPILTRELIYTGVTRARKRVTVLTDEGVLRLGLQRRVLRASGLGDVLWSSG